MKLKICGITRPEDVRACEEIKTDLIGFINIKRSLRFMELDKIRELTSFMKDNKKAVLVIEPEDLKEAEFIINKSGIRTVQIHSSSLSSEDIDLLRQNNGLKYPLKIIKAIGIPEGIDAQKKSEIENYAKTCDSILFDYEISGKSGGTGKQIPFDQAAKAAEIAKNVNTDLKLFLAGGLNIDLIKDQEKIIADIFDFIDVNSGVEDLPGIKNHAKIEKIAQIVQNYVI